MKYQKRFRALSSISAALLVALTSSLAQAQAVVNVRTYFPAADSAAGFTNFLRVINTGGGPTAVTVARLDGPTGLAGKSGVLMANLPAGAAQSFSPQQIEAALGGPLSAGDLPRLQVIGLTSSITVQSLMLQPGGVFTEISDFQSGTTVPVRTYIPAAEASTGYVSYLRLVNTGTSASPVTVALIDAATGVSGPARQLIASLPAGAAGTFTSGQIEALIGAVPSGTRPRLALTATTSTLDVQSFLTQPSGAVNMVSSALVSTPMQTYVDVPTYFPAASFNATSLRFINTGYFPAIVSVARIDGQTGQVGAASPLPGVLAAGGAQTFSAQQIEAALGAPLSAADLPRIRVSFAGPTSSTPATTIEVQALSLQPGGPWRSYFLTHLCSYKPDPEGAQLFADLMCCGVGFLDVLF